MGMRTILAWSCEVVYGGTPRQARCTSTPPPEEVTYDHPIPPSLAITIVHSTSNWPATYLPPYLVPTFITVPTSRYVQVLRYGNVVTYLLNVVGGGKVVDV